MTLPTTPAHDAFPSTSETLLDGLRRQDPKMWENFEYIYQPYLLRRILRRGVPATEAGDVWQAAMLSIHRTIESLEYQGKGHFRRWLGRVVKHRCLDWQRRQSKRGAGGEVGLANLAADADESVDRQEWRELIDRGLEIVQRQHQIEPRKIAMFRQVYLEEHPCAEVAQEFGVSLSTVYKAIADILAKLELYLRDFL